MSFGVIADIQYADVDDSGRRRFRNTLNVLDNARKWWSDLRLPFVVHIGDIIDQGASKQGLAASEEALVAVRDRLPNDGDVLCLIGNHELYNFSRERLRALSADGPCRFVDATGSFYYRYEPREALIAGWRLLIIDSFDQSLMTRGKGHGMDRSALAKLASHNPNFAFVVSKPHATIEDVNDECVDGVKFNWFEGLGNRSLPWRWTPMNGSLSPEQMRWLRNELEEATYLGLNVGLIAHVGLHPNTGMGGQCLAWNYDEVMELVHSADGSCVQFIFNGHRHDGGFVTDEHGIHHCTFESPLHTDPGQPGCFAAVHLFAQKMLITGYAPSRSMVRNEGYGRVLDAHSALDLQSRELPLRSFRPCERR